MKVFGRKSKTKLATLTAFILIFGLASFWLSEVNLPSGDGRDVSQLGRQAIKWRHGKRQKRNVQAKDVTRIFYNRVPKCGSTTFMTIIIKLSKNLKFNYKSSNNFTYASLQIKEQGDFVKEFMDLPPPMVHDRHLWFIDFTKYGTPMPSYINILRDPLERYVSHYYYQRQINPLKVGVFSNDQKSETLEHCLETNKNDTIKCDFFRGTYVKYFCGQLPSCKTFSRDALARAKQNILRYYALVGFTEHFELTLTALEKLLPRFFRGALDIYKKTTNQNVNPDKKNISQKATAMLLPKLKPDYEIYRFAKQIFYNKLTRMNLISKKRS